MTDVPHLIKNLCRGFLLRPIIFKKLVFEEQDLPTALVSSTCLRKLWKDAIDGKSGLRSLHLNREHFYPCRFGLMNFVTTVQLFSVYTAAGLETAVRFNKASK